MADGRRRRGAPKRAMIGPLVLLAGGAAAGVMLWRLLMLEPAPPGRFRATAPERLSQQDRQALERLLHGRASRP